MDTTIVLPPRSPLDSLACVNAACELYGQAGQQNLTVRKVYGKDGLRYLRCRRCQQAFSERKGTALWNTKVPEAKAVAVGEHLAEGCSVSSTVRLVDVDRSVVKRLNQRLGAHGQAFHESRAQEMEVEALQADERHGYAGNKRLPAWEAEVIDSASKFVLAHEQGRRDERLIRRLLAESAKRLRNRHDLVLFTDGDASYASLFAELFGRAYQPPRRGGGPLGTGGDPSRASASRARWRMYKLSSIVRADAWSISRFATRTAQKSGCSRRSTAWATPRPTPPASSAATARPAP